MSNTTKVRPTLTVTDCQLMAAALGKEVERRIADGQLSSPVVLKLMKLKDYMLSFQSDADKIELEVQRRLAELGMANTNAPVSTTSTIVQVAPVTDAIDAAIEANKSPLDRPDLSDDDKYDLLKLRNEKDLSEKEKVWLLNVGTLIMIRRQTKNQIKEEDL